MKYVVKCHYCGHSYIVDAKEDREDFECETCGGQNGIDDVVERIEEPVIVEKEVIKKVVVEKQVIVEKEVEKKSAGKKEQDPELAAIQSFDISMYKVEDVDGDAEVAKVKGLFGIISLIIAIIMGIFGFFFWEEEETPWEEQQRQKEEYLQEREDKAKESQEADMAKEVIQQWMTAMNQKDLAVLLSCYNIPEGSVFGEEDLEEMIQSSEMKDLWGGDIQIDSITYDSHLEEMVGYTPLINKIATISYNVVFSNDYKQKFKIKKTEDGDMKIELKNDNVASNVGIVTAVKEDFIEEDIVLSIDGVYIHGDYEEGLDDKDQRYGLYIIPMILKGEHDFEVYTSLGGLSMSCEVTDDNELIILNALQISEAQRDEIATYLLDTWSQVQAAALNYAEPAELRQFLHENITDEEIEELTKQIRMEHDLRGDYEGAYLTNIKVNGAYFYALDYDTFIVSIVVKYESANEKHATGTCISSIAIKAVEDGWQIFETYDNRFFTLKEKETEQQ